MKSATVNIVIDALDTQKTNEDHRLCSALFLLIGILQDPSAYQESKTRPVLEFEDAVNWMLFSFKPLADLVSHPRVFEISPQIKVSRYIGEDDKLHLEIEGLLPPPYSISNEDEADQYLSKEEMLNVLKIGTQFDVFFSPFKNHADQTEQLTEKLLTLLVGLIWSSSQDLVSAEVSRLNAYLLHFFSPLSERFDADQQLLVVPPLGKVRRSHEAQSGDLQMTNEFWEPIIASFNEGSEKTNL